MSERELTPEEVAAHVAQSQAEAAKAQAEAAKADAEARKLEAEAAAAEVVQRHKEREERASLAGDEWHHVYRFNGAVTGDSARAAVRKLSEWRRNDPGCDIEVVFNSPGGSVIDGMALFDAILDLRATGHRITTRCQGMAASMAGILLQAGEVRVIGKESYLLIHEVSTMAMGKIGEIEDEVEFVKKIQDRVLTIFAERSNLSKATIRRRWRRKDWWLSSDEALKFGFVDEVR